jgi:hypothetical protein
LFERSGRQLLRRSLARVQREQGSDQEAAA